MCGGSASAGLRAAAVDGVGGARYPRGTVGGEKETQLGALFGRAASAQRVFRLGVFEEVCVLLLGHPAAPVNLRDDDAGIDGVDPDALRCQLQRGAARQLVYARLRDAVG